MSYPDQPGPSGRPAGQPPAFQPQQPPYQPYEQPSYQQPSYQQHEAYPPDAPVPDAPVPPQDPAQPAPRAAEDPRLGLDVGRFWAGALATIVVAALIGLVAAVVIGDVLDLDVQDPPDLFGTGSSVAAWTVVGGLFALLAAVVLHLLVLSTPRPRTFFGWVVALVTVILAALPFAGDPEVVPAAMAAFVWVVLGIAVWSLLTGVLGRTLVRRRP